MKTLEEILQTYCGCEGPAFDEKTGELTEAGTSAYKTLEDFLNDIDTLVDHEGIRVSTIMEELDQICDM